MESQILSASSPPSLEFIDQLATAGALDELSNIPGAIRHHIFHSGLRDKDGKTWRPLLFVIYQTERHGPQNGYRFCLVNQGYYIASDTKQEGEPEDEIDQLERDIPRGHKEIAILGRAPEYTSEVEI